MRYLLLRILVTLLLVPNLVLAQGALPRLVPELKLDYVAPPLVAVPAGDDVIVAVRQGEAAPFAGQLMNPATATRWMNYLEQARFRLREDVVLERRTCNANMEYYERRVALEQEARSTIEADYRDRLLRMEQRNADLQESITDPSVFKSPVFWFVTGIVTTGVIFGVSAYSLHQVQ